MEPNSLNYPELARRACTTPAGRPAEGLSAAGVHLALLYITSGVAVKSWSRAAPASAETFSAQAFEAAKAWGVRS